ncbi:GNAT family N-acetyltransferase [Halorubrum sp. DTA98]|uniref:GNAT family N-acetyltransferase n=1 Tax=Halorubrum sp. DTA98 TaxID=3402163 RepID=UPI003AAAAAE3
MNVRAATTDDIEEIREVAGASLTASYGHAVNEDLLEGAVERWYDVDELGADVADPSTVFLVADDEGTIVGFAESYIVNRRERVGEIDWLHVHPDYRSEGIGSELLARVEADLRAADVANIEGRVLVDNEAGTTFYEREGYERSGERHVDIGDGTFVERAYLKRLSRAESDRQESYETDDGDTVYVAFERSDRGSLAPFYAVYSDEDHEDRYGYLCGNCESTNVAIDTMDRVECLDCSNRRKPTRWDAAY